MNIDTIHTDGNDQAVMRGFDDSDNTLPNLLKVMK